MNTLPACQVCNEKFALKGHSPFLLPCLHAVCETCVTSAAGGVISCTTCQREANLTEIQLQKDLVREKEIFYLTVQHHPAQILCTHEDDSNQAVCWCKVCEDFLCENCQTQHESFKASKKHSVLDFGDVQPGCIDDEKYCKTHPRYPLESFDKTCNILICSRCRRGEHVDHDIEDFEDAAKSARTELTSLEKEVGKLLEENRVEAATFQTELRSFTETCDTLIFKISHTFQSLKSILDKHEKELLVDLNQHKERVEADLSGKTTVSDLNQQRCRTTSDYINKSLLYSSKCDILTMMKRFETTIKECLTEAQLEDHPKLILPQFCDRGFEKLTSTLSSFGSIETENSLAGTFLTQDTGIQTEDTMAHIEDLKRKLIQSEKNLQTLQIRERNLQDDLTLQKEESDRLRKEAVSRCSQNEECLNQLQQSVIDLTAERDKLEKISSEINKKGIDVIIDERVILQRINIEFDTTKFRADTVHITEEGDLVNRRHRDFQNKVGRFKKYEGTRSIAPLTKCGFLQYFEVKITVHMKKTLPLHRLLLEVGLARVSEQDQQIIVCIFPHSYSLILSQCPTHRSICRKIWRHGKGVLCMPDTFDNTPGTSASLHYGFVYDHNQRRILVLDVGNMTQIGVIADVDDTEPLWPMFGVYNEEFASVRMSLVVGSEIDMSDEKKTLLYTHLAKMC